MNMVCGDVVIKFGFVVMPEQPAAFANAILKLAQNSDLRARLGIAGSLYAKEHLDRDVVLARFENEVKKILD